MPNVADQFVGATVYDTSGDKIGTIRQLYLHGVSRQPRWVTVGTGLFGLKKSLVPLAGANYNGRDAVRVAVSKDAVKHAPRIATGDQIASEEEARLMRHYGLGRPGTPPSTQSPTTTRHPMAAAAAAAAGIGGTAANTSATDHRRITAQPDDQPPS
jgi:hypothetical protein